jgi:hypothetical protein
MKNISLYTLLLLTSLLSCKAQKLEVRELAGFDKIKVSGFITVLFRTSDTNSVKVSAKASEIEKVLTRVENSTLIISTEETLKSEIIVYVAQSTLSRIETIGTSKLKSLNQIKTDSIELNATGVSSIKLDIDAVKVYCYEDGAASIILEGNTNGLTAELSGAASLKAYKLVSKNASVNTSGAANARINVSEKLRASASGASDIKIKGDLKEYSAAASSAATISRSKETSKNKDQESCDTTFYNWRHKRVMVYSCPDDYHRSQNSKQGFKHWAGFSMASNGYLTPEGSTTLPSPYKYMELDYGKSFNYQFNLIENQINLVGNRLKLISGFGFDYHSYALANKTTLNPDSSYTYGTIDSTEKFSYKKNRLRSTYIQVPLLLEYNSSNNPKKTFHIAAGVVGQFIIASRTKQILGYNNAEVTNVRKDSYNLSPWLLKAHLNFGYANWTFFAEYNLTPMFQSVKGPELYPFNAGLRIIPFNII